MKRILLIINILFISLSAFAWQAPTIVTDAFQQKFDGATNVKWEKNNENFVASFDLAGKRMTAIFNPQGQWFTTETEIGSRGLPALAKVVLQTRFIGWQIATAHKVDKPDGTDIYKAHLKKNDAFKEVLITKNGAILK